ncbi:MAG TPA: YrdB family protein [Hanamia sp.]|nr:YrdB family protein [Hanamia sp.]
MLKTINLTLRAIMEAGIVLAFGFWGYHLANRESIKILLAIIIPLFVFGFWGLVDFHQFGRFAEPLRLIQELLVTGAAAFVLYLTDKVVLCWVMLAISILHHILVYVLGGRLLKN